jgi:hypothetical protein
MIEKDCYAHLPVYVYIRLSTHYTRNIYTIWDIFLPSRNDSDFYYSY